jgi:heat shock protein beta
MSRNGSPRTGSRGSCTSAHRLTTSPNGELILISDKHSTFSTTFPIYIKERKTTKIPVEAPQSPAADGDTDELNEDLETDAKTPETFETLVEEKWVRVNDKAPIWMRWVPKRTVAAVSSVLIVEQRAQGCQR